MANVEKSMLLKDGHYEIPLPFKDRQHPVSHNRIAIIRDDSDPDQWRHVSGDLNPGENLSRGLSAEALLSSDRWIKGPAFL